MFKKIPMSGKDFVTVIINTATLLAFFVAFNFFNSSPSIKIESTVEGEMSNNNLLHDYYEAHGLEMPDLVKETFKKHWMYEEKMETWGKENPLIDWIKFVNTFLDDELTRHPPIIDKVIAQIEKSLQNKEAFLYKINVSQPIPHVDYEKHYLKILNLKKSLSKKDYFNLLVGLKSSFTYMNHITIENDGEIDLRNLKITIAYPMSIIYGNRKDSFHRLHSTPINIFHALNVTEDSIKLKVPQLKMGKSITELYIYTKEQPLNVNEILYSYEKPFSINFEKTIWMAAIVFIGVLILSCFGFKAHSDKPS